MPRKNPLDCFVTYFLHFLGSKLPNFFLAMLDEFDISKKQKLILKYWYVEKIKTELIFEQKGVNLGERQVYNLHKDFIDKFKSVRKPR